MRKLLVALLLCSALSCAYSEKLATESWEMFPTISMVEPLPRFEGDQAQYTISLYAMQNANHFFDAYEALVTYHNEVASAARSLTETNHRLVSEAKQLKEKVGYVRTNWALIGFGSGIVVTTAIAIAVRSK